ncbi:hypothetical protein MLC52_07600 [Sulfurimonas sp. NW15]|uniref:hypothetical protein n=1 Tax=Sulfurimonas sp. NW15 TaxID=2922729 RepID=UPI003DA864BE
MNKKSRFCLFTCSALVLLSVGEIFYLQMNDTLKKQECMQKKKFVQMTTVSNFVLALKNNSIKTIP